MRGRGFGDWWEQYSTNYIQCTFENELSLEITLCICIYYIELSENISVSGIVCIQPSGKIVFYLRQKKEDMFSLPFICLSVCLFGCPFVCEQSQSKTFAWIFMKFLPSVPNHKGKTEFYFG